MVLGIISIVIGAVIFIVIGGFILITIHKCLNKNQEKTAPPTVAKNIEEKKELTLSEIRGKVISELI